MTLFFFFLFIFFFFKQKTAYEIMPSLVGSEMCIRDSSLSLSLSLSFFLSLFLSWFPFLFSLEVHKSADVVSVRSGRSRRRNKTRRGCFCSFTCASWLRRSKASGSQRHALSRDWVIGFPSGIIR